MSRFYGARVILLDDVLTTGAAKEGCIETIKKVGPTGFNYSAARVPCEVNRLTLTIRFQSALDLVGLQHHFSNMTAKVEIYTKFACPFCVRAKHLLDDKGVAYEEYDITMGGTRREEMVGRVPGARTVPQIFINNKAIGGSDDLYALERQGKLNPMLADSPAE